MSGASASPNGRDRLEADERWNLVQRIVASSHFQKALQLRDILLYVSRRALEDNPSSISEYEVGCNALGRRSDFATNEDNIVRVQMRHLRKRLDDYFNEIGADEPLVLTIPKGSYVPHFEARTTRPEERMETATVSEFSPAPPVVAPPPAAAAEPGPPWRPIALVCLVLLGVLIPLATVKWRGPGTPAPADNPLWSKLFVPDQPVNLVISDSCLVMLQDVLDTDIALSDYVSGGYPGKYIASVSDTRLRDALQLLASRQYTSLGDMTVVSRYGELGHRFKVTPRIRYARHLNPREFKTGNFIIIGSRRGIPWIQLFEPQLNFVMQEDPKTRRFQIVNKDPRPGEQPAYGAQSKDESYAVIALLPNLAGTGSVLLLSGITMEMTEVAGELVATEGFSSALSRMLNSRPGEPPASYIEILIQAKTLAGTARNSRIVAYRLITPQKAEP